MKKLIAFAVVCCMSAINVSAQDLSPTISTKSTTSTITIKEGVYYLNNNLYTGTYTSTDENGAKKSTLEIKEGKAHGVVTYFYASGKVMEKGSFVNGEKNRRMVTLERRRTKNCTSILQRRQKRWFMVSMGCKWH